MKYFIGIDGGATNTRIIIMNSSGETLFKKKHFIPSNISIEYKDTACDIMKIINDSINDSKILSEDIISIGIGVAGASFKDGRDFLFGLLDQNDFGQKTLIMSDIESAYEITSIDNSGILATVGTGVNFLSKDSSGTVFTAAGAGHDTDLGSGFWVGKEIINRIGKNESALYADDNLSEIFQILKDEFELDDLQKILETINSGPRSFITKTASIAKSTINLARGGNEIALSVIQQAAMHISDYIVLVTELQNFFQDKLTILGNGSLLKNNFYRKLINQSLKFHFKKINWIFSEISPSYGSAIIAARSKGINISVKSIIDSGDYLGS